MLYPALLLLRSEPEILHKWICLSTPEHTSVDPYSLWEGKATSENGGTVCCQSVSAFFRRTTKEHSWREDRNSWDAA